MAVYVNQQEKFDYTVNHTDAIQQLRTCMPLAITHMHVTMVRVDRRIMTSIIDPSGPGVNGKPPKKAQRTQRNGWHIRVIQYLFPVLGSIIVAAAHTRPFPGLIHPPTRGEIRQTRTCKLIWQQPEAEEVFSLIGRRRQTHPELYRHHHVHQWHNEKAAACTKHIGLCPEPNKL